MEVKLVSFTKNPIETIYMGFMNMHNDIDENTGFDLSDEEKKEFMEMLILQPHQTVFEYVNTVWIIKGVSRAFQQQITRTRLAAFSNQSLRIVQTRNFASRRDYTGLSDKTRKRENFLEIENFYDETMSIIEQRYNKLLDLGAETEDARGVLPLNIHSPITHAINLRSLYHMLGLRFCDNTQQEFREVAKLMREEVENKMDPILAKPMRPLCFSLGHCPSPVPCGKYNMEKSVKMDVSRWIKG